MKRYYELAAFLLCTAVATVFIACFEAHFANEEGKYLFVYTADLLKRFWPFGEWHYPGAPVNGNGALFLHVFFSQFYYHAAGIYAVLLPAFGLWLFGWYRYGRRTGLSAVWRGAMVYPLATALFLFATVSPKFPPGLHWGLLTALWLCVWSGGRDGRTRMWRVWLGGTAVIMSMGFFPFLFFIAGYCGLYWTRPAANGRSGNPVATPRTGRLLRFGILCLYWLTLPFIWTAISRQPLPKACDAYAILNWHQNGISKDWKLYLSYQKTWRALRRGDYREALKQADRYWFSGRAPYRPDLSPGEQYFRRHLAEATKLALLMSGELNNRFLMYGTLPEMASLFHCPTPMVSYYDPIYQQFYWETGALTAAAFEGVNIIERDGLRADVLPTLALTQVCLNQYGLADKYLYLLRHTLFYRSWAESIMALNRPDATDTAADTTRLHADTDPTAALIRHKRDEISPVPPDVSGKNPRAEMAHLLATHPHNFHVAEYLLMQHLLDKNLPAAYEVLKLYRRLGYGYRELPIYAQEAMLLYMEYGLHQTAFTIVEEGMKGLEDFRFNPAVIKRFENFLQEKWNFETGRLRPEAFFEKYENSYAFFYLYLKNIDPVTERADQSGGTEPLVH
ncbi:MAG: hypothetical protein K2O01_03945 [Bacteroidales bacterium]|nr:hypothetical protein [Bacteroidales bacterium]